MHLRVNRENLEKNLAHLSRIVTGKGYSPSLNGIMFVLENQQLTLMATDGELALRLSMPLEESKDEGTCLLPARQVYDLVKNLKSPEIELSKNLNKAIVEISDYNTDTKSSTSSSYKIRPFEQNDFPAFPAHEPSSLTLDSQYLLDSVKRVSKSAARDASRPILTGMKLEAANNELVLVATDSFRMAVDRQKLSKQEFSLTVPAHTLSELVRILSARKIKEVSISSTNHQVVFEALDIALASRLLQGNFPPYKTLLPENLAYEIEIDRVELLEAVQRASLFCTSGDALKFHFSANQLELIGENPELGSSKETLTTKCPQIDLEIGFNPGYLKEGLENFTTSTILFGLNDVAKPGLLQSKDQSFQYLIMPMRLGL
jgi:DNA polymerase-3 subunit beta